MKRKERIGISKIIDYPYIMARRVYHTFQYVCSLKDIYFTKKQISSELKTKNRPIKVAFLIQYIPGWNKLEPIYKKMLKDSRFEPVIICIPLAIQNNKMLNPEDITNDTFDYFINHGYNVVNALIGKNEWLDLKTLKPDYVFHSRPYNHFMPIQYTSNAIRKYALICNVLYGANTTKDTRNVIFNREYFNDVYCYFAFDKYEKQYFERRFRIGKQLTLQHCFPYGTLSLEQILSFANLENVDLREKKVMWTPRWSTDPIVGGSNFFRYKDIICELAEKYQDVTFIIRPHPLMFDNFVETGEMSKEEVCCFRKYCYETHNIILDETKEYTKTFWETDFIIADLSGIIPEYYVTNHPIIFCQSICNFGYMDYFNEILSNNYVVYNEKELIDAFLLLYENNDYKKPHRQESIKELFGDIENTSINVLQSLASLLTL